ncbi:MAG TPA: bifunctional nuclease domain-containing protein, partial [Candidatus Binataceae bacterium]
SSDEVRVEVVGVQTDSETGVPFVLLEDRIGGRRLPIWIGESEARSILFELHGLKPERPLTYNLMRNIIVLTGNHVDRAVISEMREETYFALVYMNGGRQRIDSRPSDAIALALASDAPVYVVDRLFEAAPAHDLAAVGAGPEVAHGLGLTVQDLSAPIAKFFGVSPGEGVLVADAKDPSARAGIQHGDVLISVGGQSVKTIGDFERVMGTSSDGPATVTILRDGQRKAIGISSGANQSR